MEQLLQKILEAIEAQSQPAQPLGFGHPPIRRRIYCNLKYAPACMYFWHGGEGKPEPIEHTAITCFVESIDITTGEYKGKENNKAAIHIQADAPYTLVIGIDTLTVKSLLLGLEQCDLSQPVTFAFRPGDVENSLFCDVFQGGDRKRSDVSLVAMPESDVLDLIAKINRSESGNLSHENSGDSEEHHIEPLSGQTELISSGGIVDQLNQQIKGIIDPFGAVAVKATIEQQRGALGEAIYGGVMSRLEAADKTLDYADAISRLVHGLNLGAEQARSLFFEATGVERRNQMDAEQLRHVFDVLYAMWVRQQRGAA